MVFSLADHGGCLLRVTGTQPILYPVWLPKYHSSLRACSLQQVEMVWLDRANAGLHQMRGWVDDVCAPHEPAAWYIIPSQQRLLSSRCRTGQLSVNQLEKTRSTGAIRILEQNLWPIEIIFDPWCLSNAMLTGYCLEIVIPTPLDRVDWARNRCWVIE